MRKHLLGKAIKTSALIVGIFIAIPLIFIVWFGISFFLAKANQVTQAEADKVCQEFYKQVKSDVENAAGYIILNDKASCEPSKDESGFTDYYFDVRFKVAKAGNESPDGIKANINQLSDQLPNNKYVVWIRNQPGRNNQPESICVNARKQIQENGEEYQSMAPQRIPSYIESSEFNSGFNGACADL